ARARAQLIQQSIISLQSLELGHFTVVIVQISEGDGLGRAHLLASREDFAVVHAPVLFLALDLSFLNSLHAVGTLLHYPAAANRYVGIAHPVHALRLPIRIEVKIEAPDFIRTVVRTVAGADAAVVHHLVETFGAVNGCRDRADHFAGRVLAMHAGNRLVVHVRIVGVSRVVAIYANPMHVPAARNLIFANHRDVVLRLAG